MLAIGEVAPDFKAESTSGTIWLADLLGRSPVVLYFFPKANTSG
ncbi:MAG: redoxin domain-containing protein [Thermoleophilia bacterium]